MSNGEVQDHPIAVQMRQIAEATLKSTTTNFGVEVRKHYKMVSLTKEKLLCTFKAGPESLNMMGILHGGCFSLMADELSTVAIMAADQTLRHSVTISLSVNFLASVPRDSIITVECIPDKVGRNVAFATINFYDEKGSMVANAKHVKAMLGPLNAKF